MSTSAGSQQKMTLNMAWSINAEYFVKSLKQSWDIVVCNMAMLAASSRNCGGKQLFSMKQQDD